MLRESSGSIRTTRLAVALSGLLAVLALPVAAEDTKEDINGAYLIGLFNDACVPSRGNTDKIHAFASEHHFVPITNPKALDIFVGPGGHGIAWQVPSPTHQHFALSIRGTTEACVVWAQVANPAFVEAAFRKDLASIANSGLDVKEQPEETADTPVGQAKSITFQVISTNTKQGFSFMLTTAENPGGPFQASIQLARIAAE